MQAFPTLNRNWLSCFGNIMRTGGIKGLYAGLGHFVLFIFLKFILKVQYQR